MYQAYLGKLRYEQSSYPYVVGLTQMREKRFLIICVIIYIYIRGNTFQDSPCRDVQYLYRFVKLYVNIELYLRFDRFVT